MNASAGNGGAGADIMVGGTGIVTTTGVGSFARTACNTSAGTQYANDLVAFTGGVTTNNFIVEQLRGRH